MRRESARKVPASISSSEISWPLCVRAYSLGGHHFSWRLPPTVRKNSLAEVCKGCCLEGDCVWVLPVIYVG